MAALVTERTESSWNVGANAVRAFDVTGVASEGAALTALRAWNGGAALTFPSDLTLVNVSFAVKKLAGGTRYACEVRYGSSALEDLTPQPGDTAARLTTDQRLERVAIDTDVHGNPITNSAGQPFSDPPTVELPVQTWTARVRLSTFPQSEMRAFVGKINDASFSIGSVLIGAAGTVRCDRIAPAGMVQSDAIDVLVDYQFTVRPATGVITEPFKLRVLDRGTAAFATPPEGGDDRLYEIKTATRPAESVLEPVLLDGLGAPLRSDRYKLGDFGLDGAPQPAASPNTSSAPGADREAQGTPVNAVWLQYDVVESADFSQLSLP